MEVNNINSNIKSSLNKLKSNNTNRLNLIIGEFIVKREKKNRKKDENNRLNIETFYTNIDKFLKKLDQSDILFEKKIIIYQHLFNMFNQYKNVNLNKSYGSITDLFTKLFMINYNFLIEYILYKYLNEQEHKCNINKSTETCKKMCPNLKENIEILKNMKNPPIIAKQEFIEKKTLIIKLLKEYYSEKCSVFRFF